MTSAVAPDGAQRRVRRPPTLGTALVVVCLVSGAARADEPLYYEKRGHAVVFTNTPSSDTRVVPGWDGRAETLPRADQLPATPYDRWIASAARDAGLSPALVKAVVWAESGFNPRAVSPKGALGLMQLMPATAAQYGVTDPFDPIQNLRAGARFLSDLLVQFHGDLNLALAAYNAGPGTVRRHGGVPDYPETQKYVAKIRGRVSGPAAHRIVPSPAAATASTADLRVRRGADGTLVIEN